MLSLALFFFVTGNSFNVYGKPARKDDVRYRGASQPSSEEQRDNGRKFSESQGERTGDRRATGGVRAEDAGHHEEAERVGYCDQEI